MYANCCCNHILPSLNHWETCLEHNSIDPFPLTFLFAPCWMDGTEMGRVYSSGKHQTHTHISIPWLFMSLTILPSVSWIPDSMSCYKRARNVTFQSAQKCSNIQRHVSLLSSINSVPIHFSDTFFNPFLHFLVIIPIQSRKSVAKPALPADIPVQYSLPHHFFLMTERFENPFSS